MHMVGGERLCLLGNCIALVVYMFQSGLGAYRSVWIC